MLQYDTLERSRSDQQKQIECMSDEIYFLNQRILRLVDQNQ